VQIRPVVALREAVQEDLRQLIFRSLNSRHQFQTRAGI
jgi:hypothetical protein